MLPSVSTTFLQFTSEIEHTKHISETRKELHINKQQYKNENNKPFLKVRLQSVETATVIRSSSSSRSDLINSKRRERPPDSTITFEQCPIKK
jgi:hypothetical protein